MPIYEYFCPDCKVKFEMLRPVSKANEGAACLRCHKEAKRVLSRFCCVSKDASGATTPVGGSSCSSCGSSSCGSCH